MVECKYAKHLDRQKREIAKVRASENLAIPGDIPYATMEGLSNEERQKLLLHQPSTLGDANRISGITPNAIMAVYVYVKNQNKRLAAQRRQQQQQVSSTGLQ